MIDERAARGFAGAEHYDAYRPSYPPAAITHIREAARLGGASTVVDLGAGTGLMTRLLAPVGRLIAVEPLDEMRAVLEARLPNVEVLSGTAERIPLPSDIADAVVAAQAFHWFAGKDAVVEIARVLKADGALVLVWNEDDLTDKMMVGLENALVPYRRDSPRYDTMRWQNVFDSGHSPLRIQSHATFSFDEVITLGHLKGRILSISYVAVLPEAAKTRALSEVEHAIGLSDDHALVTMKHVTEVYVARPTAS